MEPADVSEIVKQQVEESQNSFLSRLETLVSNKLNVFQQQLHENQRELSDAQVAKIQLINNEAHKFNKKGNEEQFKLNSRVSQKLREADAILKEDSNIRDATTDAQDKISEGLTMLEYRQKLIKLADSSEFGWKTVKEYEANSIADNSDDEKKMVKAENRAQRKIKVQMGTRRRFNRTHPYAPETHRTQENTTSGNTTTTRRPGFCFACGKPGHWRAECKELVRSGNQVEKMSITNVCLDDENMKNGSINEMNDPVIQTPVGRLRTARDYWVDIGAIDEIIKVIENGYRLPFHTLPESVDFRNNRSSLEHGDFVEEEINKLLLKGCISEVYILPYVINPLTVSQNKAKLRLVLDCRHINTRLFKYKFKYEDSVVCRDVFKKGDSVFGFDLKSAYHHVEIFEDHRQYLGFAWDYKKGRRFFVFNVLPFGISTAGYIFTKLLRQVVRYWRSQGKKIIMFLDDGIGGGDCLDTAQGFSLQVQSDLKRLGFLVAEEKCQWIPQSILQWLGLLWDFNEGKVYIVQNRVHKLCSCIEAVLRDLQNNRCVHVKKLACIAGQVISTQVAVGKVALLKSREMYKCINSRASWNAPIVVSVGAESELLFWLKNIHTLNGTELETVIDFTYSVYTDASASGYGGYIIESGDHDLVGSWSDTEKRMSSTWRELEAVNRMLHTCENCLEGHKVQWYTDNKNVVSIIQKGSTKVDLQAKAIEIYSICENSSINMNPVWIPRSLNSRADVLSRCSDSDDWQIEQYIFRFLHGFWGPYTCDVFACDYNAKCAKYYSRWWCSGTSGIDAFMYSWGTGLNWWVPPPRLICKVISKIVTEKACGTLMIPLWRSAPFWSKVHNGKMFRDFVRDFRNFSTIILKKGRGNNGIFGKKNGNFSMVALKIQF